MKFKVIKAVTLKSVGDWEIEKTWEILTNDYGETSGNPIIFYSCIQDDTIIEVCETLKEAQTYCKTH